MREAGAGTDAVVRDHKITCSHIDAFRFFTTEAEYVRRQRAFAERGQALRDRLVAVCEGLEALAATSR